LRKIFWRRNVLEAKVFLGQKISKGNQVIVSQGATTLSMTALSITTLGMMELKCHYTDCHYVNCCIFIVMLDAVVLNVLCHYA
jgi:hypothetical protein